MNFLYLNQLNVINIYFKDFFDSIQTPILTKFMVLTTDVFDPVNIFLYCLILAMFMWLHKKLSHMTQFICTMATTGFVALGVKEIVRLPRPGGGLISEIGYGFASAHAMMSVVFFTLLAYSYKNHFKNKMMRSLFVSICICVVLIVSASRVYLGVHYATDVIGGLFIGLIISAVSILMYEKHHSK